MESLLADELRALGVHRLRPLTAGVSFEGDLTTILRVCLYSRVASRLMLPLARVPADDIDGLYQGVVDLPWEDHLRADGSLAVDFSGTNAVVRHTRFGAMKVKDAVVDRLRHQTGQRPDVRFDRPDLRIYARLTAGRGVDIGIDLSGDALHRRGYRVNGGNAPLKENLAAAILLVAGWPEAARAGAPFMDPMCGSGTLLIEAAWMAGDVAPGLARDYFGFLGWRGFDAALWAGLVAEAKERARAGRARIPVILGHDRDLSALMAAQENVAAAGLTDLIQISQQNLEQLERPLGRAGLVAVNPPYGTRQGELESLVSTYALLGNRLRTRLYGWQAAVFTAAPLLSDALGSRPRATRTFYNGPIPCRVLVLEPAAAPKPQLDKQTEPDPVAELPPPGDPNAPGAVMFANRLRKNRKRLEPWLRREGVTCYRVYDADIPEYAVAVDLYGTWVHLQEYRAPAQIDPEVVRRRLGEVLAVLPIVLGVAPEQICFKTRRRQSENAGGQYRRLDGSSPLLEVEESGLRFLVNLTRFLDVGLFLDHAPLRRMIRDVSGGRRFLNLFGYTGTATVYAAAGGASATVTVDLSRHYLEWAGENLALNGFVGLAHRLVRADCLVWLQEAVELPERYGLILLDPPTFSNSARMERPFDLQREHVGLITLAARLLTPDGVLFFSTNARRFRLDADALPAGLGVQEITRATIGPDFRDNPTIHRCWRMGWQYGGGA
ncbi:MAG: bifunctional 23S rRNA (guanine(2069)-N(7))-methyltransferase RlmK/23S rRNA (guanine(2445)-N(2))-methyltransferase RlmL [Magnetococcales bacterium]|nr:bifunctional 23S rRNA (guanine(2069)-N(7))-methyltransferase RlmK/23S rRNA (guanine(2445)-N(2))-methyltransferase RlmL [Magnetococcales bacterium]NGZ06983.1 bifunctional 23S rRNA (guanine(2069)-N(7))-methyltransferase RlmK/23S rRNA (guanine(2445)-N(2))-methyltransferase RlmL [Magnetococcales bacterium]